MNLKPRFLLLTGLLVVASATAAWFASRQLAEGIVEEWAVRYAEKQVLYDKARTLQPILREVALSRQLVNSRDIIHWARHPDDPEATRKAVEEMENYRGNFADHSYFVALRGNGRYYHNNAANEFAGRQFRYILAPGKSEDRWFYDVIQQRRDMHINVNPDVNLGVTKLWIDVLIRDGEDILGVAGTGLDLTSFIKGVLEQAQPGITSLFVDHGGAIQIYRDQRYIDYASITKSAREHKTLELLFDRPRDSAAIHDAMQALDTRINGVMTRFVQLEGRRYLAGVAYLPEIDWYEITLLDLDLLLPLGTFSGILLVYGVTLVIALLLFNMVLGRQVLAPLARLRADMERMERGGEPGAAPEAPAKGEIGDLMRHFLRMADGMRESRHELEDKVRERTEALDRLTKVDPLTELLNRRGMTERIEAAVSRAEREQGCFGLLWLDIDYFKEINDRHGHAEGDATLKAVSELLRTMMRPYDSTARWGGDEFLVLIQGCEVGILANLGERIRATVPARLRVGTAGEVFTVSVGGHLAAPGESMEDILQKADKALYEAKAAGRNCFRMWRDAAASSSTA